MVLTLVERIRYKYMALKITGKISFAVKEGIAYLKEYYGTKFGQVFKTITRDNGSEFAELSQIENDASTRYTLRILTVLGKEVVTSAIMTCSEDSSVKER